MIKLINANLSDAKFLYKIYRQSIKEGYFRLTNSKIFTKKIFFLFLRYKLYFQKSLIFIENVKNCKFGFVQFDLIDKKTCEISIGILSKFYNKGLGSKLLNLSIKKFTKIQKRKIVCLIIKTNERTKKIFLKNNFKLIKFDKRKHKTLNTPNLQKDNYFEYKG